MSSMIETMLPGILKMIGPEKIKPMLEGLEKAMIERANEVELQENEDRATGLIYEEDNKAYFAVVTVDNEGRIARFVEYERLSVMLYNLIENLK